MKLNIFDKLDASFSFECYWVGQILSMLLKAILNFIFFFKYCNFVKKYVMKLLNFKKLKNDYIIHEIEVTKMYLFKLNLF